MIHRNTTTSKWTLMSIESLFERGTIADWKEFARALRVDPALAQRALKVCHYREPDGAEGIALSLIAHFHPSVALGRPG